MQHRGIWSAADDGAITGPTATVPEKFGFEFDLQRTFGEPGANIRPEPGKAACGTGRGLAQDGNFPVVVGAAGVNEGLAGACAEDRVRGEAGAGCTEQRLGPA